MSLLRTPTARIGLAALADALSAIVIAIGLVTLIPHLPIFSSTSSAPDRRRRRETHRSQSNAPTSNP